MKVNEKSGDVQFIYKSFIQFQSSFTVINNSINVLKYLNYETNEISAVKQLWKENSVIIQLILEQYLLVLQNSLVMNMSFFIFILYCFGYELI